MSRIAIDPSIPTPTILTTRSPDPGPRITAAPAGERSVGDGGETRCGDVLYVAIGGNAPGGAYTKRRLCGDCSQSQSGVDKLGCGDVLERHDRTPAPAPASPDSADAGCPACGMSGWTPELAERFAPHCMAALRSAPSHPIPDQPAAECWDCRRLRAAGHDPEALAARDLEEHGTPYSPHGASA